MVRRPPGFYLSPASSTCTYFWLAQNRFGEALGEKVWESCNAVFDRLPLAGVIDQDIFCVHGGIPRPLAGSYSRIQASSFEVGQFSKNHGFRTELHHSIQ